LGSGCRWRDCPPEYGPSTTIYNRYNRWSAQGLWRKLSSFGMERQSNPFLAG
jgi:transposase